jgi:hypothetical protein
MTLFTHISLPPDHLFISIDVTLIYKLPVQFNFCQPVLFSLKSVCFALLECSSFAGLPHNPPPRIANQLIPAHKALNADRYLPSINFTDVVKLRIINDCSSLPTVIKPIAVAVAHPVSCQMK